MEGEKKKKDLLCKLSEHFLQLNLSFFFPLYYCLSHFWAGPATFYSVIVLMGVYLHLPAFFC